MKFDVFSSTFFLFRHKQKLKFFSFPFRELHLLSFFSLSSAFLSPHHVFGRRVAPVGRAREARAGV